jgi:hypothetical protein
MPFGPLFAEVFFGYGGSEIDFVDVGQCAEPGDDIREFFFEIFAVVAVESRGQLTDFFDEPEKCFGRSALAVNLGVAVEDVLLERGNREGFGWHSSLSRILIDSTAEKKGTSLIINQ